MYPIHTPYLFTDLFDGHQTVYSNFGLACDLIILPAYGLRAPIPERHLKGSVKPSKLQFELPAELLQAIFLELDTVDDAKAAIATCRTMYSAFEGYKKKIIWNLLCREIGAKLPGTCEVEFMLPEAFGGLAIFVSPRRGTEDKLLALEMSVSTRPQAPMLGEHGDLAWGLVTLGMAADMLSWYRRFMVTRLCDPRREWSACVTSMLVGEDWVNTASNCVEHLFRANAVRFRLRCRMVLNYKPPGETPVETPRPSVKRVTFPYLGGGCTCEMKFR